MFNPYDTVESSPMNDTEIWIYNIANSDPKNISFAYNFSKEDYNGTLSISQDYLETYTSEIIFNEARWDDCHAFDITAQRTDANVGSLSTSTGATEAFDDIWHHHKGEWVSVRDAK